MKQSFSLFFPKQELVKEKENSNTKRVSYPE